jgi:hypothetical protein
MTPLNQPAPVPARPDGLLMNRGRTILLRTGRPSRFLRTADGACLVLFVCVGLRPGAGCSRWAAATQTGSQPEPGTHFPGSPHRHTHGLARRRAGVRTILYTLVPTPGAKRLGSTAMYPPCPSTIQANSGALLPRARRIHCFYVGPHLYRCSRENMRNHNTGFAALTFLAVIALARADEKHSVLPWPYGLYDKNIQRQDSSSTNAAAERPLKVLYYSFDNEALVALRGFTNTMSIQTSPLETARTNAVKFAKPGAGK